MKKNRRKNRDKWQQVPENLDKDGNKIVQLIHDDGEPEWVRVDRMIAEAFIGPRPTGCVLVHKDGNPLNCAAANLEYVQEGVCCDS